MILYDHPVSANCLKVRILLAQLGVSYERVTVDLFAGETRRPEHLARNPDGRVPVLELDSGELLPESAAIMLYLAEGTPYLPDDRYQRAQVLQWLFFEQYDLEPNIAVARFWLSVSGTPERWAAELPAKQEAGYRTLAAMERHLAERAYLVGERYTVADIALYGYTNVAEEGGFELGRFPAVQAWLARVAAEPGHIPIDA